MTKVNAIPPVLSGSGAQVTEDVERLTKIEVEYDVNNNPIFLGEATPGTPFRAALWRIRKHEWDANGNLLRRLWADGDVEFNNVWDNRASLDYS
jgi:YD repeat-containing protein